LKISHETSQEQKPMNLKTPLTVLTLLLAIPGAQAGTPAPVKPKLEAAKVAPVLRNTKVVNEIKDVAKWMNSLKSQPNAQMSLYPSCPDGRNTYIMTEKTSDFCCEQDAYGCKSWQNCSYFEGKCSGGATVMGDRFKCSACTATGTTDKPAEMQTH